MATIRVVRIGDTSFRVTVEDGSSRTTHEVTATADDVRRYGGGTPERLVEASFGFLLEREPKESILPRFALPLIERYFPEYPVVIRQRLG